ncbi:MAG: anti-phage deoxyguanosine triphosphatase [Alphaproteobacteria bacterium]
MDQTLNTNADPDASCWHDRREGRRTTPRDDRSEYEVDYSRIIHSSSFRRLQGKTQILAPGDSDYMRTRLTHSLEVGQIAGGIAARLRERMAGLLPGSTFYHMLGFAHDLGHPPFGHGGETALNYCMRDAGGFEGNGQTLRILTRLEQYSKASGSNLTRRSLLGLIKYPVGWSKLAPDLPEPSPAMRANLTGWHPPKCHLDSETATVDWVLEPFSAEDRDQFRRYTPPDGVRPGKPLHKSVDCAIMEAADDISYGVHDLEDGIALSLIRRDQFDAAHPDIDLAPFCAWHNGRHSQDNLTTSRVTDMLFGSALMRKRAISRLISWFISQVGSQARGLFSHPLLDTGIDIAPEAKNLLTALQALVRDQVILSPNVQQLDYRGQQMVVDVFDALSSDPERLLPAELRPVLLASDDPQRVICDHVSALTDQGLARLYSRLFLPEAGSVFDRM